MIFSLAAIALATRLSGRILLQVESHGEAWYVNPVNDERYFLGSPDDAWNLMRSLALGISDSDLNQIPLAGSAPWSTPMAHRLAGRILLQVEGHGEAWYVDPVEEQRVYLGRPSDAFALMRTFGLGITNMDLAKVPVASVLPPPSQGGGQGEVADVPFTSQAPFGEWSDPRQQDGCEEASALMAAKWALGQTFTLDEAKAAILGMSGWEKATYGTFMDTSISDTAERLLKQYLQFTNYQVKTNIGVADIKAELALGKVVIIAVDGTKLQNPNFTDGGPARHMLVVIGYDASTDEFITNDPGTRAGAGYRYSSSIIAGALRDYPSGDHAPLVAMPTAMIVVSKN